MEEIVRRLRNRDSKSLRSLKESMPIEGIREADEDEEEFEDPDLEAEEAELSDEELPDEGDQELGSDAGNPSISSSPSGDDEEIETPDDVSEEPPEEEHTNPLDNTYAEKYQLGQEVVLAYANGMKSKLTGVIDGYDKEGFYRVKWYNGKTTNGITDIALADLVDTMQESKCVCGSTKFINEGKHIVCDECGRYIRENKDPLALADKSRPEGKRMIRSEAHPMSTAISENKSDSGYAIRYNYEGDELSDYEGTIIVATDDVEEAIKIAKKELPEAWRFRLDPTIGDGGYIASISAWKSKHTQTNIRVVENCKSSKSIEDSIRGLFKKKKIDEDIDEDDEDLFSNLSELKGEFWTRTPEMLGDIRALGYDVLDANSEYIIIGIEDDEGEDHQLQIPVTGTSRTITLDIDKARIV